MSSRRNPHDARPPNRSEPTLGDLDQVEGKPRAIVRRALHRWLQAQRQRVDISSQAFEALLVAVEAGKPTRHSLGAECFGVIREGSLRVVRTRKTRRNFQRRTN